VRKLALPLLAVFTVVLTLGLGELLLRALWRNPFRRESPELVLTLRAQHANSDREFDRSALHLDPPRIRFRTDAHGFIEPVERIPDPELRLAVQGGSTTECLVVQEELRWPNQVAVQLEPLGFRVNVWNAGLSGNTAHDSLVNLIEIVAPLHPDAVLLMNAINDAGLLADGGYALRAPLPDGWRAGGRFLLQKLSADSSIMGLVRRSLAFEKQVIHRSGEEPMAYAHTPDPEPYAARLRSWVRTARAFGIEPVLVTEPLSTLRNELTPPWTDAGALAVFNARVRAVGSEEGAAVIDLAALVQAQPEFQEPAKFFYDGMHVNDDGARIYGRLVATELAREVLPKLRAARASQPPPQIAR